MMGCSLSRVYGDREGGGAASGADSGNCGRDVGRDCGLYSWQLKYIIFWSVGGWVAKSVHITAHSPLLGIEFRHVTMWKKIKKIILKSLRIPIPIFI